MFSSPPARGGVAVRPGWWELLPEEVSPEYLEGRKTGPCRREVLNSEQAQGLRVGLSAGEGDGPARPITREERVGPTAVPVGTDWWVTEGQGGGVLIWVQPPRPSHHPASAGHPSSGRRG
ncbi:MAG: hypothetical protein NTY66_03250 [Candidatus Vogelbacteria bacterium]|nr:hypothetical protein [Candidatus Vogelbacteria bacterium]